MFYITKHNYYKNIICKLDIDVPMIEKQAFSQVTNSIYSILILAILQKMSVRCLLSAIIYFAIFLILIRM